MRCVEKELYNISMLYVCNIVGTDVKWRQEDRNERIKT